MHQARPQQIYISVYHSILSMLYDDDNAVIKIVQIVPENSGFPHL